MANTKGTGRLVVVTVIVVTAMVLVALYREPIRESLATFQDWAKGAGWIGIAGYILMYVVATVAFLPGWILSVGAGLIYGVALGSVIISIGSTLGATIAFVLARTFLRGTIENKVAGNEKFSAIDEAVGQSGWKIVLLLRLSPIFPFNLLNYGLGLTPVPLWHYVLASWAGMIPGTILYVYLGSLGNFFAADREKTLAEKIFFIGGLVATAIVTVLITRTARRALQRKVE